MSQKVFITGATGFVGTHLVNANLAKGNTVRAFVLPNDPEIRNLQNKNVEIIYGDIRNYEDIKKGLNDDIDIVFHCAAFVSDWGKREIFEQVMMNGTENVSRCQ